MSSADPRRRARLQVFVTDEIGRPVRDPGIARWLGGVAPAKARGLVVVALVSDHAMRRFNRVYARHDAVTDVLSFPAGRDPAGDRRVLGDIVIATGRAARQARGLGHSLRAELRVLALHGLLHLLGYDHHRDDGRMARTEQRLRRRGGLAAGLIERGAAR